MTKAPLPSWADTAARRRILDFVARVTHPGGRDYVPPADRVAVFDNDGTLWVEHPLYTQGMFAMDRAKSMAASHPELAATPAYQAMMRQDLPALAACGKQAVVELLLQLHAHATEESFAVEVRTWLAEARHPRFERLYTALAYQPMRELLAYLSANDFRNFIVTAGGIDFVRAFCEEVYGVPRERVIGSSNKTELKLNGRRAEIRKLAELQSFDEYAAKPVNIALHIGRRPIVAFGNSDGDMAMLQYADSGPGRRLVMLLRHDDEEREYAYDRDTHVGRLDVALATAAERGWTVVSMKEDWLKVFKEKAR
ncbi:MAG: haloacid dehalogenase-like hydrolase [Caulobacter sp.]|nr:haloacid dehalogenase-like hydrolase [Caulobacter sp.]